MIKPNVTSWRSIQVANLAEIGRNITKTGNRYGFTNLLDSHVMKNTEWASVAYLSQSKYGKIGNREFSAASKEVYQNKSNQYITGCSYGAPSNANTDYGCQYTYNVTKSGTGASTTGTIYGVYDMSGGSWEYVMGNYKRYSGKNGEAKYYNFYTTNDPQTACNGKPCYSYCLQEVDGWYGDHSYIPDLQRPWILYGGMYNSSVAGVFNNYYGAGHANGDASFRLVLSAS